MSLESGLLLDDFKFEIRKDFDDYFYIVSKWKGSENYAQKVLHVLNRRFSEENLIQEKKNEQIVERLRDSIKFIESKADIHDPNTTEWCYMLNTLISILGDKKI